MKKAIASLLLVASTISIAHAQRYPGPRDPRDPRDSMRELRECQLRSDSLRAENFRLNDQLNMCLQTRGDSRRSDQLERENADLRAQNSFLTNDNIELRRTNDLLKVDVARLEDELRRRDDHHRDRGPRFFSYAACTDTWGNPDMKYLENGVGEVQLVSETNAKQNVQAKFKCNYGVKIVKTEDLAASNGNQVYCSAGCTDTWGNVDEKYIKLGQGMTRAEAEFKALKDAQTAFSCNYSVKIKVCQ